MQIISSIEEFRKWRKDIQGSLGFVPTMGALHKGHLSLVETSNRMCDTTIVSIYVNPTQFNPNEDLDNYPRDLSTDKKLLKNFSISVVFIPTDDIMYQENYSTFVGENRLSKQLEGKSRPTHFDGVTTIVTKLFNIIQPSHAFFGEKDAQQIRIIQKMVTDLNFPIEIVSCPIIREANGLAMSSRNKYLSRKTRENAGIINKALEKAKQQIKEGEISSQNIRDLITKIISSEPLAKIDYISIADNKTLIELEDEISGDILVSVAIFFGQTRLIDNFSVSLNRKL